VTGADCSLVAQKFVKNLKRSPPLAVKVLERTGRRSARVGEALPDII
jgi:hypothetical protein